MIEKSNIWHSAIKIHKLDHCSYDCCKLYKISYCLDQASSPNLAAKDLLGTKCTQNSKKRKKESLAEKEEEEDNSGCGKQKQNVSINTT